MSAFPRRAAVALAIAGLAASFANPASASGCRVDVNADVTTSVASVHVSAWHDEGQEEPGVYGQRSVVVSGVETFHVEGESTRSEGTGIVETLTGVDVREIVCGALEG